MAHEIGWNFPSNGGGVIAGFNDSGIETFAGQPFESLAREIIQNSLDARASNSAPITVRFRLKEIRHADFPGHGEMLGIVKKCLTANQDDPKAKEFFENAKKILKGKQINCLEILDSNTTGLQDGANGNIKSGHWHRLIKATGKPQTQDLAGGSFGIGKNAPFAVSDLRTVFYFTRYCASGKTAEYAQGKAILVSHEFSGGGDTQAVGFYGVKDGCGRLESNQIPAILMRRKNEMDGTTILIPGMREVKGWEKKIVAAVISNFFFAIDQKDLVVMIEKNGKDLPINHDKLPILLGSAKQQRGKAETMPKFLHGLWDDPNVKIAREYYHAIKKGSRVEIKSGSFPLEHCVLWIAKGLGLPQSVAMLRRGMKITSDLPKLKRWGGFDDFAAVCICESGPGNALLRRMENPAHNAFEHDRLRPSKESEEGKKALEKLGDWIRGEIRKIAEDSVGKPVPLDAMREFFSSEEEDDDDVPGNGDTKDVDPIIPPKPIPPNPIPPDPKEAIGIESVRILRTQKDNVKHVNFTPKKAGKGALSVEIAGDSSTEKVRIKKATGAGIRKEKGRFVLDVKKGKRVSVEIELFESLDESLSATLTAERKK